MHRRASVVVAAATIACLVVAPVTSAGPVPTPIGVGPRFHPSPTSRAVAQRRPLGRLGCSSAATRVLRAHVEVFAQRRVVVIPARIGVSRGCAYPVRTREPTGVVEFEAAIHPTLGDLFAVWGRPLSATRLLSFRGRVRAYVQGARWSGPVSTIPLRRHAEIVLEVGGFVPPHRFFLFGPGR